MRSQRQLSRVPHAPAARPPPHQSPFPNTPSNPTGAPRLLTTKWLRGGRTACGSRAQQPGVHPCPARPGSAGAGEGMVAAGAGTASEAQHLQALQVRGALGPGPGQQVALQDGQVGLRGQGAACRGGVCGGGQCCEEPPPGRGWHFFGKEPPQTAGSFTYAPGRTPDTGAALHDQTKMSRGLLPVPFQFCSCPGCSGLGARCCG